MKSPTYTNRILRETGAIKPKISVTARLKEKIEDLKDQVETERRRADQLEIEIAFLRRDLISANQALADWQQRTAQRNEEWR